MKRNILILISVFFCTFIFAQQDSTQQKSPDSEIRTLLSSNYTIGGYGGINVKYGNVDGKYNWDFGFRAGAIFNHKVAVGLGVYGFVQEPKFDTSYNYDYGVQGGYAGLFFEPILLPKFPIHVSFPIFCGIGGASYVKKLDWKEKNHNWDDDDWNNDPDKIVKTEFIWVIEPGAEIELNVFKHFRVAFDVHYRFAPDVSLPNNKKDVLRNFSTGITLKFGKF